MGGEISSEQLFQWLYGACDIIRGPVNQDEYKSYLIPLLFFKRISDVYDEETTDAEKEFGAENVSVFPEDELHRFKIPEGCHWNDIREKAENVGLEISRAMRKIEKANPETLSGAFSSFDDANWSEKTKITDDRMKSLVEHMSMHKIGNNNYSADVIGDAYEYLLKKFADLSKKNAGEFYTPRSIVKLLVMLLAPKAGETVYDPACGTGGMLIEALRQMKFSNLTYGKIYGQEKNMGTSAMAQVNLYLHGAEDFRLVQGDTLRDPRFIRNDRLQTFDCVVANPPFSLEKWGAESFLNDKYGRNLWGCPTDVNGDYAWLQHMVASMKPDSGRCAVILSQGVLFRNNEKKIRQGLVESDKLDCIITLQSGVFFSTGVSACILFLRNDKPESHKNRVCLIDGTKLYTPLRAQNVMTEENIQAAYKLYSNYADVIDYAKVVFLDEIRDKDYSLAVNSYIKRPKFETEPPAAVRKRYFEAYKNMLRSEERMKELLIKGKYVQ